MPGSQQGPGMADWRASWASLDSQAPSCVAFWSHYMLTIMSEGLI
jgi:hypothetical protein